MKSRASQSVATLGAEVLLQNVRPLLVRYLIRTVSSSHLSILTNVGLWTTSREHVGTVDAMCGRINELPYAEMLAWY